MATLVQHQPSARIKPTTAPDLLITVILVRFQLFPVYTFGVTLLCPKSRSTQNPVTPPSKHFSEALLLAASEATTVISTVIIVIIVVWLIVTAIVVFL